LVINATTGDHFDVVILGGGPGGTAAGLTLLKRDRMSVAIIERSDYGAPRIGESLSPGMRALLDYLDVWKQFQREQSLECYGTQAAWGSPSSQSLDYLFTVHGTGWGLDRVRFDRMLANAFRNRGGKLLTNTTFKGCERSSNGWKIQIASAEKADEMIGCSYLIDATGRPGRLARSLDVPRTVHDRLVGVGCIGQAPADSILESVTHVEACEYGWWYTASVPANRISVILMSDADIVRLKQAANSDQWRSLLKAMPLTSDRLSGIVFPDSPKVFSSSTSCLQQVGGEGWVAVGDAIASHDPLSSSGIPHAIGSGVHGARVAADALFASGNLLEHYQRSIHEDFGQYLRTHWQYYQQETRWPRSLFWKRRRSEISIDPYAVIAQVDLSKGSLLKGMGHLSPRRTRQLYQLCRPGSSVHQIARAFTDAHPEIPDPPIILELQELVESGHVTLVEV
jgi:flavin-dependent dehydrogenase